MAEIPEWAKVVGAISGAFLPPVMGGVVAGAVAGSSANISDAVANQVRQVDLQVPSVPNVYGQVTTPAPVPAVDVSAGSLGAKEIALGFGALLLVILAFRR